MKLAEDPIFPSIQGEGIDVGTPATFLRLWGCSRNCSWCDTPEGKAPAPFVDMEIEEIIDGLFAVGNLAHTQCLIITGGEPLEQAGEVSRLLMYLRWLAVDNERFRGQTLTTALETSEWNWAKYHSAVKARVAEALDELDSFASAPFVYYPLKVALSPKLFTTDDSAQTILGEAAKLRPKITGGVHLKVVFSSREELILAEEFFNIAHAQRFFPKHLCVLQPEQSLLETEIKSILGSYIPKYRVIPQLHVLLGLR